MGDAKESFGEGSLADKLGTSLLVDHNRIPYVQMNGHQRRSWTTCDKAIFWTVPLILLLVVAAMLLLVVSQKELYLSDDYDYDLSPVSIESSSTDWNEIVFTQLWGYSSCLQFKDRHHLSSEGASCRYEDKPSFWSIHGIWPSREGTEGPSFCTKVKFDITQLDPIRNALDQYWYEIDSTKDGGHFWSHEWTKHGSCAKQLNLFETELKYFTEGLDLRTTYDLYSILKSSNIIPESPETASGYSLEQINAAIQSSLGSTVVPYVQCLSKKDEATNEMDYYLLAVELCFDKSLQFIGCRTHKRLENNLRDNALPCPADVPIKYLDATA